MAWLFLCCSLPVHTPRVQAPPPPGGGGGGTTASRPTHPPARRPLSPQEQPSAPAVLFRAQLSGRTPGEGAPSVYRARVVVQRHLAWRQRLLHALTPGPLLSLAIAACALAVMAGGGTAALVLGAGAYLVYRWGVADAAAAAAAAKGPPGGARSSHHKALGHREAASAPATPPKGAALGGGGQAERGWGGGGARGSEGGESDASDGTGYIDALLQAGSSGSPGGSSSGRAAALAVRTDVGALLMQVRGAGRGGWVGGVYSCLCISQCQPGGCRGKGGGTRSVGIYLRVVCTIPPHKPPVCAPSLPLPPSRLQSEGVASPSSGADALHGPAPAGKAPLSPAASSASAPDIGSPAGASGEGAGRAGKQGLVGEGGEPLVRQRKGFMAVH